MTRNFNDHYTRNQWRLIWHEPFDGAMNMAIDEAISEAVGSGEVPPTLRFYAWEPACLSLGYGQRTREVDFARIAERGWQVVRRSTGGQAILHTDEVTYSVSLPANDPRVEGDIVESYRRLSRGLLAGLALMGTTIRSDPKDPNQPKDNGPVCFEVPSDYEITSNGKKLLGSAQRRRAGIVLQHGTLPLTGDITRICGALCYSDEAARDEAKLRVAERATTLEETLGYHTDVDSVVNALSQGFAEALNLDLVLQDLSDAEWARAEELSQTRYGTKEWTRRRW